MGSRCYECAEIDGYCTCPDPRDATIAALTAERDEARAALARRPGTPRGSGGGGSRPRRRRRQSWRRVDGARPHRRRPHHPQRRHAVKPRTDTALWLTGAAVYLTGIIIAILAGRAAFRRWEQ